MSIHNVYVGNVPKIFTEDAVPSHLCDVNIKYIIRVSKLFTHEKHAGFRAISENEDTCIINNLYV